MNHRNYAVAACLSLSLFACGSAPSENGQEATVESDLITTCPAGQVRQCQYEQDIRQVVCECVPGNTKTPWSGQSISVTEHPFQTPGYGTVTGRGWKPGDVVTIQVNSGCGSVESTTTATVAADGTFVNNTNYGWQFCHSFGVTMTPGSFVVSSRYTTAYASTPTWMYWD